MKNTHPSGLWLACLCLVAIAVSGPALAHGKKAHQPPTPIPQEMAAPSVEEDASSVEVPEIVQEIVHEMEPVNSIESAHDHSAHGPNAGMYESTFGRVLVWIGRLHPAMVHFPIGLLIAAAGAELLSLWFSPNLFRTAVHFCLWAGAVGAFGAAMMGWFYGGFRLTDTELVMTVHRWNGTGIAVLSLLLLWMGERRERGVSGNTAFRSLLFSLAVLVGINGYSGGYMVYGPEQHQWPVTMPENLR